MIKNFDDLYKAHFEWCEGVLLKEIKPLKKADVYIGKTPDAWFNFALPKVEKPNELDIEEVKKALSPVNPLVTIYLLERHVKSGFSKFLLQNGYELFGEDSWVVFNHSFTDLKTDISIERINLSKFPDYEKVTVETYEEFFDFDDRPYNEICRQVLTGEVKSRASNFSAEFFMVYENGKPTAGAGLFLTDELGYFHNDATLKEYQKRGYHAALIKERIIFCQGRGIKTLYSIASGESSLRNYKRCGFKQWQKASLFTLKSK